MKKNTRGLKTKEVGIVPRRGFIKTALAGATLAGTGNLIFPRYGAAKPKTLKIMQWIHYIPGYDKWFNESYVKEWGAKNDTEVIVDNISLAALNARADAEALANRGHDLFLFLWPRPDLEQYVIDLKDVYDECIKTSGKPIDLAIGSSYNPKTKKYYGLSSSFVPGPIEYRKDLWDSVGMYPDTWDDVRIGGARIKKKHNVSLGLGLASEIDSNMGLRSIMYSLGASVQDEEGNVALNSKQTLDAIKFVKAMYEESMTPDVFTWDASSNNRFMLTGKASLTMNAISITRTAEKDAPEMSKKIWLAKAPKGSIRRMGLQHVMNVHSIWKFAENIEGAKKFLVDYVSNSDKAFLASEFYNFPCFPKTVPDLKEQLAYDKRAYPTDKYKVLEDVQDWATNIGYPGYVNAGISEVFGSWIIPNMFRQAATGEMSPEDALNAADRKVQAIFNKWRAKGVL
ncbi:MAG: extracellular solute-binding protein [Gammaproteobacteria bacterium]|nr:extracellular solute-binding protein [Gammaproteobacteria bacterium]MDX2461518.1 extracellular solute-binding protein [Gammaproteobacteria bacterium]